MSAIKPRTRGKHFVEHRTRLDRENHETLYAYAAFLDEEPEYVLNQLIEMVLARDRDFTTWRVAHPQPYAPPRSLKRPRSGHANVPSGAGATGGRETVGAAQLRA